MKQSLLLRRLKEEFRAENEFSGAREKWKVPPTYSMYDVSTLTGHYGFIEALKTLITLRTYTASTTPSGVNDPLKGKTLSHDSVRDFSLCYFYRKQILLQTRMNSIRVCALL